jgi:transcription initiation factor TFIIB
MGGPGRQRIREADAAQETGAAEAVRKCPECESTQLTTSSAGNELVCDDCGLVLEENLLDRGPEWRALTHQERDAKSRVGAPTTARMHDKGLTTTIDWKDRDAHGNRLSSEQRNQMQRLRTWQKRIRTQNAGERNLQFALAEIDRMASSLSVPRSVREVACVIYRRALAEDLIRGRSIEGIATAALYAACQNEDIPRSLDEIAGIARVPRKEIARAYRYVAEELGLEMEPVNPKQYLPRFCSNLGVSEEIQTKAAEIIDFSVDQGLLSGKSPTGSAGAAIYTASLLCDEKQTQADVAEVARVTEVTIRNRYQEQIESIGVD